MIASIPPDKEILFLPDRFLGAYLQRVTGRPMTLWFGECHVHAAITADDVNDLLSRYPDADLLLHPECGCVSQCLLALAYGELPADADPGPRHGGHGPPCADCERAVDLVGTEVGMLHRLRRERRARPSSRCGRMQSART